MNLPSPPIAPQPTRASVTTQGTRVNIRGPRRFMKIALPFVLALFLVPILLVSLMLATPQGTRALVNSALSLANPWPRTTLRVGGARAGLWGGIELHALRLVDPLGRTQLGIDTLAVHYSLTELVRAPHTVRGIEMVGVRVVARQMEDGRFDLLAPFTEPQPQRRPPSTANAAEARVGRIVLRRGALEARLQANGGIDSLAITDLAASITGLRAGAAGVSLGLDTLGARLHLPGGPQAGTTLSTSGRLVPDEVTLERLRVDNDSTRIRASGRIPIAALGKGRFDGLRVRMEAAPLAARDIASVTGRRPPADLRATLVVDGADSTLDGRLEARGLGGHATAAGRVILSRNRPLAIRLTGAAHALDFGAFTGQPAGRSVLEAQLDIDLRGSEPARISGPVLIVLDHSQVSGVALERARVDAQFDEGRARVIVEGRAPEVMLRVTGTMQPFDSTARYDLNASLAIDPASRSPGADSIRAMPVFAGVVNARVVGDGWGPASARVVLTATPDPDREGLIGAAELDAHVRFVPAAGGEPTLLAAEFPRAACTLGSHTIEQGSGRLELRGARVDVDARAVADGAGLEITGVVGPSAAPWRDVRLTVRFRDLDLAKVSVDPRLASDFEGRIDAHLTAPDLTRLLRSGVSGGAPWAGARGETNITLGPSGWGDQRIETFTLHGELAHARVRLDGRMESTFGRVRVAGSARPFDDVPSVELGELGLEGLDVGSMLRLPGRHTDLSGRVTLRAAGRDSSTLRAEVRALLDGSGINRTRFDRLRLDATIANAALEARLDARSGSDSAGIALAATPALGPTRATLTGAIRLDTLDSLFALDLRNAGVGLVFNADLVQPPGTGVSHWSGGGQLQGWVRAGECRLDTVVLAARLDDGVLDVSRLTALGTAIALEGAGRVVLSPSAPGSSDFHLRGRLRDVSSLAPVVRSPISATSGQLAVDVRGPAKATELEAAAIVMLPRFGDLFADSVAVRVHGTWADTLLRSLDAGFVGRALTVGPLLPRDVKLTGGWDGRAATVDLHSVVDRDFGEDVSLRYEPGPTRQRLVIERANLLSRGIPYSLKHPTTIELGDRLHVDDLVMLRRGIPLLTADGGIEPDDRIAFTMRLDSLDVGVATQQVGLYELGGAISGSATLAGTRAAPELEASWHGQLTAGPRRRAVLDGTVRWAGPAMVVDAAFVQAPTQRLDIRGTLPLQLTLPRQSGPVIATSESPMSGSLVAQQFSLGWFAEVVPTRVARRLDGWLNGTLESHGSLEKPSLSGTLSLSQFQIEPASLGARFEKGEARLTLSGETARLERLSIDSGPGSLEVSGTAVLGGARRGSLDLSMNAKRFMVLNNSMGVVTTTGSMGIGGTLRAPDISGSLELLNTTVYLETGGLERDVEPVPLTEKDQRELRRRFGLRKSVESTQGNAASDSVGLDVTVRIGQNVWARRHSDPVVSLEMQGQATVHKERGGRPTVKGEFSIETGRSYLSFIGRRFEITSANVALPGPIEGARAELSARYIPTSSSRSSGSATVYANTRLDPTGVTLDLRSEPYMARADLINYLATGTTQGSMESGTGAGLAVGAALGAVGGAAGRSLGFQVVQVSQDAYGGQILSAGNYVDPRVYLGFRQPVVEGQTQSRATESTSTATEFEVEFEATRQLLFNVQGGGSEYRFLLRPRLGR